jgi:hypothetical protein
MGTRYEEGDLVRYGDRVAGILEVRNPESSSPNYVLNFLDDDEHPPEEMTPGGERFRASHLEMVKTAQDVDVVTDKMREEIEEAAEREFAMGESHTSYNDDSTKGVANSGDAWAVERDPVFEDVSTPEEALKAAGFDPSEYEEKRSGGARYGGRVPSREVEFTAYGIVKETAEFFDIGMEPVWGLLEQEFGTYNGDVMYWTASGEAWVFEKVNQ